MALKLLMAPTVPCVTLADAKLHCRVDVPDDDALITQLVDAATQDAEHLMQRAIMPQQWQLTLDAFPSCIELQRPIVTAINSVKYVASATGTLTTLAGTEYLADLDSELVGRVTPAYGKSWPDTRVQLGAVQIVFTCGWPDANSVPAVIKRWICLRVGALYENREAWTLGKAIERNEFVDQLLDRYRIFTV